MHHGTLNAVILPATLRFNQSHAEAKYAVIRSTLGLPADADLADYFAGLSGRLGLPKTLGEMGVPSSIVPAIARAAIEDHSHATNARPARIEDYEHMLSEAIG